jgi:hypothetical protein
MGSSVNPNLLPTLTSGSCLTQRVNKVGMANRFAEREPTANLLPFHTFDKTHSANAGAGTYDSGLRVRRVRQTPVGLLIDLYI